MPTLIQKLVDFISLKGYNAIVEKNDLLVNGYKVASYSYRAVPGGTYVAMHISMSVDIALIMNICKKPMLKVPKELNDFGVYEEEKLLRNEIVVDLDKIPSLGYKDLRLPDCNTITSLKIIGEPKLWTGYVVVGDIDKIYLDNIE